VFTAKIKRYSLFLGLEGQVRISVLSSDLGEDIPAQQGHQGRFFPAKSGTNICFLPFKAVQVIETVQTSPLFMSIITSLPEYFISRVLTGT